MLRIETAALAKLSHQQDWPLTAKMCRHALSTFGEDCLDWGQNGVVNSTMTEGSRDVNAGMMNGQPEEICMVISKSSMKIIDFVMRLYLYFLRDTNAARLVQLQAARTSGTWGKVMKVHWAVPRRTRLQLYRSHHAHMNPKKHHLLFLIR